MLKLAVRARLPLVRITTDDTLNIRSILTEIVGEEVTATSPGTKHQSVHNKVFYCFGSEQNWNLQYEIFAKRHSTLIIIGGDSHSAFIEAGFVSAPRSMLERFVKEHAPAHHKEIADALSGLSFKQAVEVSKLAMTRFTEFSPRAIQVIRRQFFGSVRGLETVNTNIPLYQPNKILVNWLKREGPFVFGDCSPVLRPRGLLFGGPPGTGKTMGAKYFAEELQQPLYRLDIGIVMSKWAGESEENLKIALRQAENCSPCVLLIDEVEKLFGGSDEGVSTRLLASLLWWLQEHQARVFTIMTTNKETAIPPELVRPGRIDSKLNFPYLYPKQAQKFMSDLIIALHDQYNLPLIPLPVGKIQDLMSHAEITTAVMARMKEEVLDSQVSSS